MSLYWFLYLCFLLPHSFYLVFLVNAHGSPTESILSSCDLGLHPCHWWVWSFLAGMDSVLAHAPWTSRLHISRLSVHSQLPSGQGSVGCCYKRYQHCYFTHERGNLLAIEFHKRNVFYLVCLFNCNMQQLFYAVLLMLYNISRITKTEQNKIQNIS